MHDTSLDIEQFDQLQDYLQKCHYIDADEKQRFTQLCGGVSNRTVLIERENGTSWVLKQALEKLRVAADWFSSPLRIHREALGMFWLEKLTPPGSVPALIFEDHEHHLIAMHAVPQPHENWKTLLLRGEIDFDLVQQFATLLAIIHKNAWRQHAELAEVFSDRRFFQSLRIEPYYEYSAQQIAGACDFVTSLIDSTRARTFTLVHGDYSPKNILVHNGKIVLLDHEVIHWGDPAFDVGFALTHLLSKAHFIKGRRSEFLKAARFFWTTYHNTSSDEEWSKDLEEYSARHTLACLLARIAGRSPLEYLNTEQRTIQRRIVVELMQSRLATMSELFSEFEKRLNDADH